MQDRFAGDIGDFGKYGLLRALAGSPLRLGIVWYLTSDGDSGGNHREYLDRPERFRPCDQSLFDALIAFNRGEPRIARISHFPILPLDTLRVDEPLPPPAGREDWFGMALSATRYCDLIFLDPDNGLAPRSVPCSRATACHYVYPEEIAAFRSRRQSVLVYHHFSRRNSVERQLRDWFSPSREGFFAFRFHRYGSRAFFLLPASRHQDLFAKRIGAFLQSPWKEHFTLYRSMGIAEPLNLS
jgi:hypothetical protein